MTEIAKIDRPTAMAPDAPKDLMLAMIERVTLNADLPMERLTALMDMRERQMNKEAEQIFNQAFADAMAEMPDVRRSGHNKHLNTRYSTLDDLIHATRPVLSRHGLSLNWQTEIDGQNIKVTAIVRHSKGHSISTSLIGQRDTGKTMNALQGGGSTETYLKRYSGFSILGLASGDEVDDDGRGTDAGTVTAEQYIILRDLLAESGVDELTFHKAFGHRHPEEADLREFPADRFAEAKKRLETAKAKRSQTDG